MMHDKKLIEMEDEVSNYRRKKRKKKKAKERLGKSERVRPSKQAKVHSMSNNSSSDCVDIEKNEEHVKRKKKKRKRKNLAEDSSKDARDEDHKTLNRKHYDGNHSESTCTRKKRKTNTNCEDEDTSLQTSCHDKKKKKKHTKSNHTQNKDNLAINLNRRHLKKKEILKNKKKTTSNKAEYDKFIIDNDLIRYVWKPSKELQKQLGLREGKWTRDEVRILKENMTKFLHHNNIDDPMKLIIDCKCLENRKKWREFNDTTGFYQQLSKGLKRSLRAVSKKFTQIFDKSNYLGKFSESEDEKLLKLVSIYPGKWAKIGMIMGRSDNSVNIRYLLLKDNSSHITGPWQEDEITRLKNALRQVTNTQDGEDIPTYHGIKWTKVASLVKTRNHQKCRKKWLRDICWKDLDSINKKTWNQENDVKLISKIYESQETEECDIDWLALSESFEIGYSPYWLRTKFSNIKRKYCNSIDFENTDFEDVIDLLYNVVAVDIQNKMFQELQKTKK